MLTVQTVKSSYCHKQVAIDLSLEQYFKFMQGNPIEYNVIAKLFFVCSVDEYTSTFLLE